MNASLDTPNVDALSRRAVSRGRYKFYSVIFGLGIFCTIFAVLVLLPFKYEAHVDILVRVDRDASPVPQMGGPSSDQIVVTGVRPEDVATEISILTGRQVAEAAYETLGAEFFMDVDEPPENFRQQVILWLKNTIKSVTDTIEAVLIKLKMARESTPREDAIGDLMKAVNVSKSVRSDLIALSARAGSPQDAKAIVSAIAAAYFVAHQEARSVFRGNEMFRDLQRQTEAQMADLGRQIEQSKIDMKVFDVPLWIERRTMQAATLRSDLEEAARDRTGLEQQVATARSDLEAIEAAPLDAEPMNSSDLISVLRAELGRAARDLERDMVRFGPGAQQVQEARAVIEALRSEIRQADAAQTRRLIRALEREVDLSAIKAESITRQIAELEAEIATVSAQESDLRSIETRRAALGASLAQVSEELTRSEWLAALDSNGPARITILEPITVSDNPVAPNKVVILLAGIVVSILGAVGLYIVLTQVFILRQQRQPAWVLSSRDRVVPPQSETEGASDLMKRAVSRDTGR